VDLEDSAERLRRRWGISSSSPDPRSRTWIERLLSFIEYPVFLTVLGIVGGVLGVFLASGFTLVLDACILLAIHRSDATLGLSRKARWIVYALV